MQHEIANPQLHLANLCFHNQVPTHSVGFATYNHVLLANLQWQEFRNFVAIECLHFCRCSLNLFDPVLRPLLYGQFLIVRCELYQICAKKSWSEFNVGIQLHPNWLNACNLRFTSNGGFYVAKQTLWGCQRDHRVLTHCIADYGNTGSGVFKRGVQN